MAGHQMIHASLEALARALARLEPDVFRFHKYVGDLDWVLSIVNFGGWTHAVECNGSEVPVEIQTNDDRLFGAVWRCAVAQGCYIEMYKQPEFVHASVKNELRNRYARADTPGVALALAYCAACGEKVGGLAT